MKTNIIKNLILLTILTTRAQAFAEGFGSGTLIETPQGIVSIEDLCLGDNVVSCNNEDGQCTEGTITKLVQTTSAALQIITSESEIILSYDQTLFLCDQWVPANKLKIGDFLKEGAEIVAIEEIDEIDLYTFTVETERNFYANNILVHNPYNLNNGSYGQAVANNKNSSGVSPKTAATIKAGAKGCAKGAVRGAARGQVAPAQIAKNCGKGAVKSVAKHEIRKAITKKP